MFKNRLREYRELRGLTQTTLAKKIGLSRSIISMYESGARKPSFEALEAIADILNASFDDLIGVNESDYMKGSSPQQFDTVPRLGRIPCGIPIMAEENIECYDYVPEGVSCDFTLLCKGDSMIGSRILDGDLVYIHSQPEVENGQIAAVLIGEESTLKRFYKNGDTITLMPDNPKYQPMIYIGKQLEDITVMGLAVAFTSAVR